RRAAVEGRGGVRWGRELEQLRRAGRSVGGLPSPPGDRAGPGWCRRRCDGEGGGSVKERVDRRHTPGMTIDRAGGRSRDRVPRMSDRWVGLAAAAAVVCGLAACGTQVLPEGAAPDSPTDAPVAEVVDSGPDCLADEVIEMLTGLPQDAGRSAPS